MIYMAERYVPGQFFGVEALPRFPSVRVPRILGTSIYIQKQHRSVFIGCFFIYG